MIRSSRLLAIPLLLGSHLLATCADEATPVAPAWKPPAADAVREQLAAWLDEQPVDESVRERALAVWQNELSDTVSASGAPKLVRLLRSIAVVEPRAGELLAIGENTSRAGPLPDFEWLDDTSCAPLVRNNARLFAGRWLCQEGYFDEALSMFDGLTADDVVDPASLLFYRAVSHHRLVDIEKGNDSLKALLAGEHDLPMRFRHLASLMQRDLTDVQTDSLDHIARRMNDIHRRLDKGRAGQKVIDVEQGVLDSLDKLIEKLEAEQRRQQQQQQQDSGGGQSSRPMEDSRPARWKAPGRVDRRPVGSRSGWGNLPDKDREEAMQQIARDFPAHYRTLIEQYFRKLAAEDEGAGR